MTESPQSCIVPQSDSDDSSPDLAGLDLSELERCAQELALPYLRVAALVRHYFFEKELPTVAEEGHEFAALLGFLKVRTIMSKLLLLS